MSRTVTDFRPSPKTAAAESMSFYPDTPSELMMSMTKTNFAHPSDQRKRSARPTSSTRMHNPHSQTFRTTQLPSGQTINISLEKGMDGYGGLPIGSEPELHPDSTFRQSFKKPELQSWQKGNVTRYGSNAQPWANTAAPSIGILPTANKAHLNSTSTTAPTTRDAFDTGVTFTNRFSSTSSRRAPAEVDTFTGEDIDDIVKDGAASAVKKWIQSAPGFEGEVVKRMLRAVSQEISPEKHKGADGTWTGAVTSEV